jgi:hypothetical protein
MDQQDLAFLEQFEAGPILGGAPLFAKEERVVDLLDMDAAVPLGLDFRQISSRRLAAASGLA